jgi:SAM-dependent methyltransferase
MNEASKTLLLMPELMTYFHGRSVIDIGAGDDKVVEHALDFDKKDGDAENILRYLQPESFQVVFASHCLEHMHDPYKALESWFSLVAKNGILIVIVPDEDLYEQGFFPSIFNSDHKRTFTISKSASWSIASVNILDLIYFLEQKKGKLEKLQLQSNNYEFCKIRFPSPMILRLYKFPRIFFRLLTTLQKVRLCPVYDARTNNVCSS